MTEYIAVRDLVKAESADVTLVAVSKTHPYEMVLEAYNDGARVFGENRVQEVASKFPLPADRPEGMKVYLIGQLQRNKAKKAVELCDRIESVDSLALIDKLEREAFLIGKRIEVLLELNSSGEESKSGFETPEELLAAASYIKSSCPSLILKGLMTVGPLGYDKEKNAKAFTLARETFRSLSGYLEGEGVLSMGMSADWKEAVALGSTEVRIGSAIFGQRDYTKH